jgi:vacuolar-type H+-ATPase subunit H
LFQWVQPWEKVAMRDVIQKVIASEAEAKQIVAAARSEGERVVSSARKRAEELRARVNRETRAEVEQLLDEASRGAERKKQECLARARVEIERHVRLESSLRQQAVAEVVRCVCGPLHQIKESP